MAVRVHRMSLAKLFRGGLVVLGHGTIPHQIQEALGGCITPSHTRRHCFQSACRGLSGSVGLSQRK